MSLYPEKKAVDEKYVTAAQNAFARAFPKLRDTKQDEIDKLKAELQRVNDELQKARDELQKAMDEQLEDAKRYNAALVLANDALMSVVVRFFNSENKD